MMRAWPLMPSDSLPHRVYKFLFHSSPLANPCQPSHMEQRSAFFFFFFASQKFENNSVLSYTECQSRTAQQAVPVLLRIPRLDPSQHNNSIWQLRDSLSKPNAPKRDVDWEQTDGEGMGCSQWARISSEEVGWK